jgi:Macrocin-O-methyltransferase (TylF)
MKKTFNVINFSSPDELERRNAMATLIKHCPIPPEELLDNVGLFLSSKTWARLKFMDFIYQKVIDVPGVIMEFGTRWGQNIATFAALRGIYEPFHRHRNIIAFDTFTGFPSTSEQDGSSKIMRDNSYSVTEDYYEYLKKIMEFHEAENPLSHIQRFKLVAGDVCETLPVYLQGHQETIVALAYFDLDLYAPTKRCLELLKPRLTKGSVLAFDELNEHVTPGDISCDGSSWPW